MGQGYYNNSQVNTYKTLVNLQSSLIMSAVSLGIFVSSDHLRGWLVDRLAPMAKKAGMAANEPHPYTTDRLDAVIDDLTTAAGTLRVVKEKMAERGYSELMIPYHKGLKDFGLPKVKAFVRAAEDALLNHRINGD